MKNIILICILFPILVSKASTIDLCDRGRIGELIAQEVGTSFVPTKIFSPPCSKANKDKISKIKKLNLSHKKIKKFQRTPLKDSTPLKNSDLTTIKSPLLKKICFPDLTP